MFLFLQDELYVESLHRVTVKKPEWNIDHGVTDISLSDLTIFSVARVINTNYSLKDSYLHSVSCGIMILLSRKAQDIKPLVCQRIISMFIQLCKRYQRPQWSAATFDWLAIFLEFIYTLLETPIQNPNILYILLLEPHIFDGIKNDARLGSMVKEIRDLLALYSEKILLEKLDTDIKVIDMIIKSSVLLKVKVILKLLSHYPELNLCYIKSLVCI